MSNLEISKKEIVEYKKLSIIAELTPLKEYVKLLEKKHECNFKDFEKKVKEAPEDFEMWDDYIEWKAYQEKINDLNKRLGSIEDAKDIKFTE